MADESAGQSVLAPPTRRDWLVLGSYTVLIVGTYVAGVLAGYLATGVVQLYPTVYQQYVFLGLFVFAPPVVAAGNYCRGGTVVGTVAVGLVPGLAFVLLAVFAQTVGIGGTPDSPLWVMAGLFSGYGVLGALAGLAVAHLVIVLQRRLG